MPLLMRSSIAASVVDLPEPVGPVTRISPRGRSVRSANTLGQFSSSSDSTFDGIVRNAAAAPRCWLNALTRNRARFGTAKLKSHSRNSSYILRCESLMMSYTMACTSSCSIGGRLMRRMSPCTRIIGGKPADRCRSDALFLTANARSSVMSIYNPSDDSDRISCSTQVACQWCASRAEPIMGHYENAWQAVRERIDAAARAAGREPRDVHLLAVAKTFPADAVRAVYAAGQRAFGENYVQEGAAKRAALADLTDVAWHLIGPLQSNKTALAAATFDCIESVDRLKIAQRLSAQRPASLPPLDVCIEVNVSAEASKSGVAPD